MRKRSLVESIENAVTRGKKIQVQHRVRCTKPREMIRALSAIACGSANARK